MWDERHYYTGTGEGKREEWVDGMWGRWEWVGEREGGIVDVQMG